MFTISPDNMIYDVTHFMSDVITIGNKTRYHKHTIDVLNTQYTATYFNQTFDDESNDSVSTCDAIQINCAKDFSNNPTSNMLSDIMVVSKTPGFIIISDEVMKSSIVLNISELSEFDSETNSEFTTFKYFNLRDLDKKMLEHNNNNDYKQFVNFLYGSN